MNFRCFSLVGLVCACAPFGVASNQVNEEGFFMNFHQNTEKTVGNLMGAVGKIHTIAKLLDVDIPQQDQTPSVIDSIKDCDATENSVTRNGGFFQVLEDNIREAESLSNHVLQCVTRLQQSLNNPPAES